MIYCGDFHNKGFHDFSIELETIHPHMDAVYKTLYRDSRGLSCPATTYFLPANQQDQRRDHLLIQLPGQVLFLKSALNTNIPEYMGKWYGIDTPAQNSTAKEFQQAFQQDLEKRIQAKERIKRGTVRLSLSQD